MFKLVSLDYTSYGKPQMHLTNGDTHVMVHLNDEDKAEIAALALRLFERRQESIVASVAAMQPRLMAPMPDAEFTEVNNVPF